MRELCSKILLICLVATIFVGCRPRGVLSNREMRDLLYDLHRCDGAVQVAGYNYGDRKSTRLNSSHWITSRMPSSA